MTTKIDKTQYAKLRIETFPAQETIGAEEIRAANEVMRTGILSHFRGNFSERFYGGPKVQEFEEALSEYIGVREAIAVNSCTSALQIACTAIGLKPGDEVIATPWSMSCSASAPLVCGATPVFADIEHKYFCLSLDEVIRKTTERTKAIIAVSLFGQSFDPEIRHWADSKGIIVIEDAAQAIGSEYQYMSGDKSSRWQARKTGTLGHIGCFSFTQGKHITAGEGGAIVTDNPIFAQACRMIRNHAEAVLKEVSELPKPNGYTFENTFLTRGMVGYNMRMTEIQAAILIEQLKKLPRFVNERIERASRLSCIFGQYPELVTPAHRSDVDVPHSFYCYMIRLRNQYSTKLGSFVNRLNVLLPGETGRPDKKPFNLGYVTPLYRMPLFSAYDEYCPFAESYQESTFLTTLVGSDLREQDFELITEAIDKSMYLLR